MTASASPMLAAQGMRAPMIIDAHCHAGSGQRMMAPWSTRAALGITLRNMAEAGIDRTIIFAIENPGYEKANEEIAEICGRYPDKFLGFARHDEGLEGARIPSLLKREINQLGLKGFKIIGKPPGRRTLDLIAELRIPVLYHAAKVALVKDLAENYPGVPFIIAHMGNYNFNWEENVEAINLARQYSNVYMDTSCCAYRRIFEMAVQQAGAAKLLFGSDGPEFDSRVALHRIRLLKLPAADEERVFGGTIQMLLPRGSIS